MTDADMTAVAEDAPSPAVDEAQVLAYPKADPLLLTRHPALLEQLEVAHAAGSAVSLIERQVELLRGKNQRLEARLEKLIDSARANEVRADKTLKLALALIRAPSLAAIAAALRTSMRDEFGLDEVFIGLHPPLFKRHDIDGIVPVDAGSAIAKAWDNFLRTRLIDCGPIEADKARLLFPKCEVTIASAAVVPLERDRHLGFIALGSADGERFQPRQGKLFLEMTAELVSAAIRTRLA